MAILKLHLLKKARKNKLVARLARALGQRIEHSPLKSGGPHSREYRIAGAIVAALLIAAIPFSLLNQKIDSRRYDISRYEDTLLKPATDSYTKLLKFDRSRQAYVFNDGYQPSQGESDGLNSTPKITASFGAAKDKSITVNDPVNEVGMTFTPQFDLHEPKTVSNHVVYPLVKYDGVKVYTLKGSGIKEDIILNNFSGESLSFAYELDLPDGTEAKLEVDGSLGVYGVTSTLLGDVSTGSEQDAELLKKARENAPKTTLLFRIPAPYALERLTKVSKDVNVRFDLDGNTLTVRADGLDRASYPLSIDPSIYVETAAKLMRGNNETNTDFDIDNELIQKSQTTGARIQAWQDNLDMSEGIWDSGTAAAGGYVYRAGGRTGTVKPQIASEQTTTESTDDTSFAMNMPATRPAGDLYIALLCHDNAAARVTPPAGWTEYADVGEHAAYYKIGDDAGGGDEAASYTFTISASEAKAGTIVRITGFNPDDPVSGLPGTGNSGSNAIPVFPATTPESGATLVIRATGVDADTPSATGWVPSGHTKIASANSGGTSCGFAAAALDTPPVAGVSTGTATLNDNSLNDTYGASSIAINPEGTIPPPQIEGSQTSTQSSDSNTFVMSMPATRPAGDVYVAMLCHDGTGTVEPPTGGGWTEYADIREFAAYYKVGTDAGGGNEAASYTWRMTSGNEIWAGTIVRVSNVDTSDIQSGTTGTGSSASNAVPVFPATTPDKNSTLVIRAVGADNDTPSATGWVPSGHTKIDSGTPNVTNDCGYVAAAMNNAPASGVSTGTVSLGDTSLNDTYGTASIAFNATPSGGAVGNVRTSINWAKFNSSTLAIESPNPGTGACSGWCNDPTYDLPSGRRGHSVIAYNGYLHVIGGHDSAGNRVSTIYTAKLGANGEPQLWHPTDTDPDNWEYWYTGSSLSGGTAKSYLGAVAYNNRLYIIGGQTDASPGGITTVQVADILPNGTFGSWTTSGMQALPAGAGTHMLSAQVYNDRIYAIGGFEGAATSSANLRDAVWYSKLNTDGTMNAWQQTNGFDTARASYGGSFTSIWGAYIYMGGGCTAVNGSGNCTAIASDMQLASINADGTLDEWGPLGNLNNARIGYTFVAWQNGLYRLGGCTSQDATSGSCLSTLADVDYGVINPAGEVSMVNTSVASGTSPCSGGSPYSCDLPPAGDDAGEGGQMLSMTTVLNGYLYVIGGCIDYDCNGTDPAGDDADITGNISYVAVDSNGRLTAPATCGGTSYGAWCVDSTNRINGTTGVAAGGITTFNGRIYVVGGLDASADGSTEIYYNETNADGSLDGGWSNSSFASIGLSGQEIGYTYAYARANPSLAGSYPGNLFIFGGCGDVGTGAGCASSDYRSEVYKCSIDTAGAISSCSTSGQLQIDSELADETDQGLGIHSGTVYANYIYLVGGYSPNVADRDTVYYAKFNNSNNVVSVATGTAGGNNDDWILSGSTLSVGRRRGFAFGYNGHVYAVGGYDSSGTGIIPFIEWATMNVSDGSIDTFFTSDVTINQRWGLSMTVSNGYAYVIGGCDNGISPGGCDSFDTTVQTFQLYNNDSGAPGGYSASANTFATDRVGASATVLDGYIYVAGGCTDTLCTAVTTNVQYASLDANGTVGSWANTTAALPAGRAYGQLETAGGSLYYMGGGVVGTGELDAQTTVYYATPSSGNVTSWGTASNGLPQARSEFSAAEWNDRLYVTGGYDGSDNPQNTVYVSPQLSAGGNITSAWASSTAFAVPRQGHTTIAYANNLYVLGGYDGSNYLNDVQYTQINADGTVDAWLYTTQLPFALRNGDGFARNGYMYLLGGRTSTETCTARTLVSPISANTTIATGNNPTGIGEWYETNRRYNGNRYGAAAAYNDGKAYLLGGACVSASAPTVASVTSSTTETTDGTTHNVTMPATVDAGDLLLVLFSIDGNPSFSSGGPSGWTSLASQANGTAVQASVWAKVAVGNEDGTNVNFQTTTSEKAAAQVYRVTAGTWYGNLTGGVSVSSGVSATTQNPDAPSLNPSTWATHNTLWLAYAAGSTYTSITSPPSNYTNGTHNNSTGSTTDTNASVSSARRTLSAVSEDPGTFTMNASNVGVAFTVAVRPALAFATGSDRTVQTTLLSQPQVAKYSRMIDTDTDVFPNSWLMNGIDNSIGARWNASYRSMNDIDGVPTDCGSADMGTWGQITNYGNVTLGDIAPYIPKDGSGNDIGCARYYYFFISIDASSTFGYPEDVQRGPTITDLSLFFTSDPNKRLRHGKTFTGGELQPLDTPCRQSNDADCPLP